MKKEYNQKIFLTEHCFYIGTVFNIFSIDQKTYGHVVFVDDKFPVVKKQDRWIIFRR